MERLWTPWRRAYVGGERATGDDKIVHRLLDERAMQLRHRTHVERIHLLRPLRSRTDIGMNGQHVRVGR